MKRISTPTAVHGRFVDGSSNQKSTQFNAEWCNQQQEELCNLLQLLTGGGPTGASERELADAFMSLGQVSYIDAGAGGESAINVSDGFRRVLGITFGTPDQSVTSISFAINGVKANGSIRAIVLQGGVGMDTRECTVTIDTNNTVKLPAGNSAIVLVDRYQDSLILRTVLLPATTATAIFNEVQCKSQSSGGGSGATMNSEKIEYTGSAVPNAYSRMFIEGGKLKARVGQNTSYAEMSYSESDGPSVKVSSGSQGGGATAEVLPGEVSVSNGQVEHLLTNNDANMLAVMKRNEQEQTYPTSLTMSYFLATEGVGIRIVSSSDSSTVDLDGNDYSVYAVGAFVFIANAKGETVTVSGANSAAFSSVTIDPGHGRFFVKTSEGFFAA